MIRQLLASACSCVLLALLVPTASAANDAALRAGPATPLQATTAHPASSNQLAADSGDGAERRKAGCQTERCRKRQIRRIQNANCRLQGGRPLGKTCTIPFGGRD